MIETSLREVSLIKANPNKGFFSKILGSMDKDTTYQLIIKEVGSISIHCDFCRLE